MEPTSYGLFTAPQYLRPLELSGCASAREGWAPRHIEISAGSAPCYEKRHSWGEFVFDFQIAQAYERHGLDYYPKLVCCVPFTPVPGPRLLAPDDAGKLALARAMVDLGERSGCSGAHILYLPRAEADLLATAGWLRRDQLRYLWHHRGYASFEDFLAQLSSKARKNIRRERRLVADYGLSIQWQAAPEISEEDWPLLFELYASTYRLRGQEPYLNLQCLRLWAENLRERMQFCIARAGTQPVALAFFFEDGDSLYGRHWGAAAQYSGLHFELCYYQGIARCIERGLQHFDAGVQGEHKRTRGFDTELSHSAHWFAHAGFREAIADFFARERRALATLFAAPDEESAPSGG